MIGSWLQHHDRQIHLALACFALAGLPGLFLPFARGASVSPWTCIVSVFSPYSFEDFLIPIAVPLFVAIPAVASIFRLVTAACLPRLLRIGCYSIACVAALAPFAFTVPIASDLSNWTNPADFVQLLLIAAAPPAIIVAAGLMLRRNMRNAYAASFNPVLALQASYIASAAVVFISTWGAPKKVGAWLLLLVMVTFSVHAAFVYWSSRSQPTRR